MTFVFLALSSGYSVPVEAFENSFRLPRKTLQIRHYIGPDFGPFRAKIGILELQGFALQQALTYLESMEILGKGSVFEGTKLGRLYPPLLISGRVQPA